MSVFIPGMEMPKNCGGCHFRRGCYDGTSDCCLNPGEYIDSIAFEQHRPEWCPLVEIKTPHGRLIDADALKEELAAAGIILTYGTQICRKINVAKTIIEAEGGGEDG